MKSRILVSVALFAAYTISSQRESVAQSVPALINYQGQLTQAGGKPLPTADYALTFSIYDAATSGNAIWGPQVFDGQAGQGHGSEDPSRARLFQRHAGTR